MTKILAVCQILKMHKYITHVEPNFGVTKRNFKAITYFENDIVSTELSITVF
jgi:hypothetical protein